MGQVKISYSAQFSDDLADLVNFVESKGMFSIANIFPALLISIAGIMERI